MNKYRTGMSITAVTFALLLLPAITNNTPLFVNAQSQSQQTKPPPKITSQPPQNTTTPQPGVQFIFNDKSKPANARVLCIHGSGSQRKGNS